MKIEEWQLGEKSKLTNEQRLELHQEWLKKIHKEMKEKINLKGSKESNESKEVVGFPD